MWAAASTKRASRVHEQNAARRAERLAARAAAEAEAEEYDGYDDDFPGDEEDYSEEEPEAPTFHIQPPGWLAGVFHWGHQMMQGGGPTAACACRARPASA